MGITLSTASRVRSSGRRTWPYRDCSRLRPPRTWRSGWRRSTVERLQPDLHVLGGRKREQSRYGQVRLPELRTLDAVDNVIPISARRRLGERGPVQVDVQRLGTIHVIGNL